MPRRGWESPWKIIRDFKSLLLPSIYKVSKARRLVLHPHPPHDSLCSQQHQGTPRREASDGPSGTQSLEEALLGCRRVSKPHRGQEQGGELQRWRDLASSGLTPSSPRDAGAMLVLEA